MGFGEALDELKAHGAHVARVAWGNGTYVALQVPDEHSKMQQPYLYLYPVDGGLVPWFASQADILADDWVVV